MKLTRLDLDGAGSPAALVTKILEAEPDLPIPVPLEELCAALDISAIQDLTTQGFAAALITDVVKSSGMILVAETRSPERRRFSIAHELGHFLIPTHRSGSGGFQCTSGDLGVVARADPNPRVRMEIEANRFASLLLIPPPRLRSELRQIRRPDISDIVSLARLFAVSKEALARAYVENSREAVAMVVLRHGLVQRLYRNDRHFPWIAVKAGSQAPVGSLARLPLRPGTLSNRAECDPELWIGERDSREVEQLTEQVLAQRDGYALLMLHAVMRDEEDDELKRSRSKAPF